MKKLFALEEKGALDTLKDSELLIDKVLNLANKSKDPVSLTAEVIKQRQEVKSDIQKQLDKGDEENSDSDNDDDNKTSDPKKEKVDELDEPTTTETSEDNNNTSDVGDDKDSIKSIIGSELSDDTNKDKSISKESFRPTKVTLRNIFEPILNKHNSYLISMEDFNISDKKSEVEHPIVYIKESVHESLNNLINIINTYIDKNKKFIETNTESIKNLNEHISVLSSLVKNRSYHFTHTLVSDQSLLSDISVIDRSDIKENIKVLKTYIDKTNQFVNYVLNNDFKDIGSALSNTGFVNEDEDFVYSQMLPGFNIIRTHLDTYENYLKSNIENFHFYQVKTFKTEHLYNLDAVSIKDDKEIDFITESLDKLLIELSIIIDNFNVVNSSLGKLIDQLKVIIYDVEQDKYKKLAELDIDSKVKDFIKFKLISETYSINISMLLKYIITINTVISKCVDLKI